jgi:2-iminoacetate synthase
MWTFRLDDGAVANTLRRAERRARSGVAKELAERAGNGDGLAPEDLARLWLADQMSTESLYQAARRARATHTAPLETFSPLYMTNTCDAECRMCGMRRDNDALVRETANLPVVAEQLRVLARRGMHAVALLTGEYRPAARPWAMTYVNEALRSTQALGFAHVLVNVGSIDDHEFTTLLAGIERNGDGTVRPKLTMCTFQETYSRQHYAKFMGTSPDNPRADYDRRLENFDRAHRAGMRVANPGILVGLNPDLAYELTALALHAHHLLARGMEVYLSVPRLRQIAGRHHQRGATDDQFVRLVALLSLGLPQCKIVITTREPAAIQRRLVPIVSVLSAGSAAVTPYTHRGARFPLDMSQFEVIDQRPFEEILAEYAGNAPIENYRPQAN